MTLKGQLLIAAPVLVDPNFHRSVVLLLEHTEEGALGVVLNRPTELTACEAVPELSPLLEDDDVVFAGGPVQTQSVIALAEFADPLPDGQAVLGTIASLEGDADADELAGSVLRSRIFVGYAGWAGGQLEGELEEDAWFTEPAIPDDVFAGEPGRLWGRVLERKGDDFRLLARMPDDPRMN